MKYEATGLRPSLLLEKMHNLAYPVVTEGFGAICDGFSEEEKKEFFAAMGVEDIDDFYRKTALRMATLLQQADMREEVIAASIVYGAVKKDPSIMLEVDGETAKSLKDFLQSDREIENAMQTAMPNVFAQAANEKDAALTLSKAFNEALEKSPFMQEGMTDEKNTLMRTWVITTIEVLGMAMNDASLMTMSLMISLGDTVKEKTAGMTPTAIDDIFEKTLTDAKQRLKLLDNSTYGLPGLTSGYKLH